MKIRVRASFLAYLALIAFADGIRTPLCLLFSLLAHEAAHIGVGLWIKEPFERVEVTPFGGMITYQPGKSASKGIRGIMVAAAGPLANYLVIHLLMATPVRDLLSRSALQTLLIVNGSMLAINLLPVLPLDGGRIVFCLLYYLLPVATLIKLLTASGAVIGAALILLGFYGVASLGIVNLSLFFVGAYMLACAQTHARQLLCENLYTVLQERSSCCSQLRLANIVFAAEDTPLYGFIPLMRSSRAVCCCLQNEEGDLQMIGEEKIIRALLQRPQATAGEAFIRQNQTKSDRFDQKTTLYS